MSEESTATSFDVSRHDALLKTAQTLAIVHNLLNQGLYQGQARKDLNQAVPFIEEMHNGVLKELEPMMEEKARIDEAAEIAAGASADVETPATEVQVSDV